MININTNTNNNNDKHEKQANENNKTNGKTIAIASGKGGTGKTTFAINLFSIIKEPAALIDCDVEEPNCHLFLQSELQSDTQKSERFSVLIPEIDFDKCTGCRKCAEVCRYNAIVVIEKRPMLFEELCHNCGGCARHCPQNAITETSKDIATINVAKWRGKQFAYGVLDVGQARSSPVIDYLRKNFAYCQDNGYTLIDCPPGTSCPAVEAVRGVDLLVLVTEPTPFGVNDLELAIKMGKALGLKQAVIVNRSDLGAADVRKMCNKYNIPIIGEIGFDKNIARTYSHGKIISDEIPSFRQTCEQIWRQICEITSRTEENK